MFNNNSESYTVFDKFDYRKYCDLQIPVLDHTRSSNKVPFDTLRVISYQRPIVTVSLKCIVVCGSRKHFEIFALEKHLVLET